MLELKATFICTKVSLVGQWCDELAKFAPALRVVVYHGCAKEKKAVDAGELDLENVDVVIGTTTTARPEQNPRSALCGAHS